MAFIAPALTGFFTSLGVSAGVAGLLTSVSTIALSVGLNYAVSALFTPKAQANPFGVKVELQQGGVVPRSFLFGTGACTGGSLVYHGATAAGGNTPNAYYCKVIALSDLPITGLTGIIVDGATVTWDPDATPAANDFGIPITEYKKNGSDNLWVTFHDGSQTTIDPFMSAWFGSDADYPYTDMIGRGVAYVRIIARVNQDLFPSAPSFKWICDGIPLYDLRDDTTAGGSGSQAWDDKSTWALRSDNATLIYNITRGIYYAGEWFYGGQNLAASRLPYDSWAPAANECDTDIDLAGGGTEKQFRVAGEIAVATQPVEAIETLLRCCNGRMAEIGGIYKTVIGGPGSAVLSITDDDILVSEDQELDPFPNLDGTINGITASYPDPDDGYELKDAPPLYGTDDEEADGDRRLVANVQYDFVNSNTTVQRLMKAALAEVRRFRRHNQVMPPSAFELEPLDVISFTSTRNGYSAKSFRIDAATDGDNCDQGWSITEVDPADFDWDPDTDESSVSTGSLVVHRPAAQAMVDWAVSGVTVHGDNSRVRAGLRLSWNTGVVDVAGVQFQVRLASDATLVLSGQTADWDVGQIDLTQNLIGDTDYEARGKYQPVSARETDWSAWLPATTPDIGIGEGELDAKLQAWLQQLDTTRQAALGPILDELRAQVDALGQTTSGLVALLNQRVEGSIVNYIGQANASITEVRTVAEGLADLFVNVFVGNEVRSANGLLRITAGDGPGGIGTSISLEARATINEVFRIAGIYLDAFSDDDGGTGRVRLVGDQVFIETPDGDVLNALLFTTSGAPTDAPITTEAS